MKQFQETTNVPQPEEPLWNKNPEALEGMISEALAIATETQGPEKIAELQVALAYTLMYQRKLAEARHVIRSALNTLPGYGQALWCEAQLAMFLDGWPAAWEKLEARWQVGYSGDRPIPLEKTWDGSVPLAGRPILLAGEGALGDQIQFVRFASQLKSAGAGLITVSTHPKLIPLISGVKGLDAVVPAGSKSNLPEYDLGIPMLSVPFLLGTTVETLPATVPYLTAPVDRVAQAAHKIVERGASLNVGLCWRSARNVRCLPLKLFRPLAEVPGVQLFGIGEKTDIEREASGFPIISLGDTDLVTAAGVIAALDLIITVDTLSTHLAGALAKPVWTLLNYVPDWRWGIKDETTRWYPTMRLFRRESRDWASVIQRVAEELHALNSHSLQQTSSRCFDI